jgi:hypothetical protein
MIGPIAHKGILQRRALVVEKRGIATLSLGQPRFWCGGCEWMQIRNHGTSGQRMAMEEREEGNQWRKIGNLTGTRDPHGIYAQDTNAARETPGDGDLPPSVGSELASAATTQDGRRDCNRHCGLWLCLSRIFRAAKVESLVRTVPSEQSESPGVGLWRESGGQAGTLAGNRGGEPNEGSCRE